MKNKPLNIIVSAFACGPKYGSEIGMGWNWVINMAQHCKLTVITEAGFKKDIEEILPTINLKYIPVFHYIDIGDKGRALFWKQGSFSFYKYYKKWHLEAYNLSKNLIVSNNFDLVHQLNMLGYREPGYLWKITKLPTIWGPIGGYAIMPWKYMTIIGYKSAVFFSLKNIYNLFQMYTLNRVKNAISSFDFLIASTKETSIRINELYGKQSITINETGSKNETSILKNKFENEKLIIIWCGLITGRKALPIALQSLSKLVNKNDFELHILGDGPDRKYCVNLAKKLAIEDQCIWHGQVSNSEVLEQMKHSDLLFFTSLVEGTPHVVLEAIASGLPVICHDSCGHGAVVDDTCGRKIPIVSPKVSCNLFSKVIEELMKERSKIAILSKGAIVKSKELRWENKAEQMVGIYKQTILDNKKKYSN